MENIKTQTEINPLNVVYNYAFQLNKNGKTTMAKNAEKLFFAIIGSELFDDIDQKIDNMILAERTKTKAPSQEM